ncbi:SDR family oxidoreductase [bacterium]|nr:MAG: SDR family oxidoreductase [bacterium]
MTDRILVTGATGTTGRHVAEILRQRGRVALSATRRPGKPDQVHLDWDQPATFAAALEGVSAVYLVAPTDRTDHLATMRPFLEEAIRREVGPLVLLSAASLPEDGPMMGEVQGWLRVHAPRWVSLRPSWFMQNLIRQHLPGILAEGRIRSATGTGRVAFIDAVDIARTAVAALTSPDMATGDVVLTGPEPLSYDDVAAEITRASGRPVQHERLTEGELAARHEAAGLPRDYAELLARMDGEIAGGAEDRTTDGVARLTGVAPTSFADFIHRERTRFMDPITR